MREHRWGLLCNCVFVTVCVLVTVSELCDGERCGRCCTGTKDGVQTEGKECWVKKAVNSGGDQAPQESQEPFHG